MPRFKSGMQRWYEGRGTQDYQGDENAAEEENVKDDNDGSDPSTLLSTTTGDGDQGTRTSNITKYGLCDITVKTETEDCEGDPTSKVTEPGVNKLEMYGPEMQRHLEDLGEQALVNATKSLSDDLATETAPVAPPPPSPRKRGRPRKNPLTPCPVKEPRQARGTSDSDNLFQVLESMRKDATESSPLRLQNVGLHLPVLTPGEHYCVVCLARHQQRQSQGGRQTRSAVLRRCTTVMCRACDQFLCVAPRADGRTCYDIFHTVVNFTDSDLPEFKRSDTDIVREEFVQDMDARHTLEAQKLLALLQELASETPKAAAMEAGEGPSETLVNDDEGDLSSNWESPNATTPDSRKNQEGSGDTEQEASTTDLLEGHHEVREHDDEGGTATLEGSPEAEALELLLKFLSSHEVIPLSETLQLRLEQKNTKRTYTPRTQGAGGGGVSGRGRGRPPNAALGRRRPRKGRPRKSVPVLEDEGESPQEGSEDLGDTADIEDTDESYIPPARLRLGRTRKVAVNEKKRHKCPQCPAKYNKMERLKIHMRIHTGDRPFDCPECDAKFMRATHLKQHLLTHTGRKPHKCPTCGASFAWSGSLKEHVMRLHTGERPFKCNECDAGFTRQINLHEHMRSHTGEKPYKCPKCDQSFARKSGLKNHMTSHTGEKPYLCSTCGARFRHKIALTEHQRTHTGEKPFGCQHCGQTFAASTTLRNHVRLHTGEKPHKCRLCGAGFAQRTSLNCHMKKHGVTVTGKVQRTTWVKNYRQTQGQGGPPTSDQTHSIGQVQAQMPQSGQGQIQGQLREYDDKTPPHESTLLGANAGMAIAKMGHDMTPSLQTSMHRKFEQAPAQITSPPPPPASSMAPPPQPQHHLAPPSHHTQHHPHLTLPSPHPQQAHGSGHNTHHHGNQHLGDMHHQSDMNLGDKSAGAMPLGHWPQDPAGLPAFPFDPTAFHNQMSQAFPGMLPGQGNHGHSYSEQPRFPLDNRFNMDTWPSHSNWKQKYQ